MRLEEAIALARRFHEGATDKAGEPYIGHPLRVMERVTTEAEKITAVLHDLLEDTELDRGDLFRAGCPSRILMALDALTRLEGESYEAFVLRAAADPIARVVKLADIEDNLDPDRLARLPEAEAARLRAKYEPARRVLEAADPPEPPPSFGSIGEPTSLPDDAIVANFNCALCGHPAGRVVYYPRGAPGGHSEGTPSIAVWGVVGRMGFGVSLKRVGRLVAAVRALDAAEIHAIRWEWTPFWCPDCEWSYCDHHWRLDQRFEGPFYDCTYGTCPEGHRVVLDD